MKKAISVALAVVMLLSVFCCAGISAFAADEAEIAEDTSLITFAKCSDPVNDFCNFFNDIADFPIIGGIFAYAHYLMHVLMAIFA